MAGIESDGRWRAYGGLAGVFVFCSIAVTGTLWHSRRSPVVRGEDHAAVAAAAYERRWALWRSADPDSLPPRFGPVLVTNGVEVRRASLSVSGFTTDGGSSLEWEGDPASWQAKTLTFAAIASDDDRAFDMRWTLGADTVAGRWVRVGRAHSNDYPHALSDTGGVFAAHGFIAAPPCLEGTVNRWRLGAARFSVSFRPDPSFGWPVAGTNLVECLATNTPGSSEALWPHMHQEFVRRAAASLRDSLLTPYTPLWLALGADADTTPVTGTETPTGVAGRAWLWPMPRAEAVGQSPFGGAYALDGAASWRALTGATNEAAYSEELGGGRWARAVSTNLLWECLRAAANMTRAVDFNAPFEITARTVHKTWTNGALYEAWTDDAAIFGATYSYGYHFEYAAAAAPAELRFTARREARVWPCASACASGLVSRIRLYLLPEASPGVSAAFPCGRYVHVREGGDLRIEDPTELPPFLAAEFTPAQWAADGDLSFTVSPGVSPEGLAAAAESDAGADAGADEEHGVAWFSPGMLLTVADFAFTSLAEAPASME